MMYLKYLIVVFLLVIIQPIYSQTYIGASIGYESFRGNVVVNGTGFQVLGAEKEYPISIRIEQEITPKLTVLLQSSFVKKFDMSATDYGYVPMNRAKFQVFNGSLSLYRSFFNHFRIGVGTSFQYIPEITKMYNNELRGVFENNDKEIGVIAFLGYEYKNFFIESYFNKLIVALEQKQPRKEFKSRIIGVQLGYRVKLFNKIKFNGRKANCPKL